jgi:ASC-1-like (ASCH) protein
MIDIRIFELKAGRESSLSKKQLQTFLKAALPAPEFCYTFVTNKIDLYSGDIPLILVESGGVDSEFVLSLSKLEEPIYLLAIDNTEAIGAALEIGAYMDRHRIDGGILFGSTEHVTSTLRRLAVKQIIENPVARLGIIASNDDTSVPIASSILPKKLESTFGIQPVSIPDSELVQIYDSLPDMTMPPNFFPVQWDYYELDKSYKLYLALKKIIAKYRLDGLTLNCFSFGPKIQTTACLAVNQLASEKYIIALKNDTTSLVSTYLTAKVFGDIPAFLGDITSISPEEGTMSLSSCGAPYPMFASYGADINSHLSFGVSLRGDLKLGPATLFRIDNNLQFFFCVPTTIVENIHDNAPNRVAIKVKGPSFKDFLANPLGNRIALVYGDHVKEISSYLESKGMVSNVHPGSDVKTTYTTTSHTLFAALTHIDSYIDPVCMNAPQYLTTEKGSMLTYYDNYTHEKVTFEVSDIVHFRDFEELINSIEPAKLGYPSLTKEETLAKLRSLSNTEDEQINGVKAMYFRRIR